MPKISVIIPAYNASKNITETIESVLAQTFTDFEVIVADDGSLDNTVDVVLSLTERDDRVKIYRTEKNQGVSKARNFAISNATGEWIAFLDSDDLWTKDKLEKQISLAEKSNADIVYCSYGIVDENGHPLCRDFIVEPETNYNMMLARSVISCSTAMIKRDHFDKYSFSTDYAHEDYALWMEMLHDGLVAVGITEVLAYYRIYKGTRSANKFKAAKNRWIIYRKHLRMSFFCSCVCILRYSFKAVKKYKHCSEK